MRRRLGLLLCLLAAPAGAQPTGAQPAEAWDALLDRVVTDEGLVRYDLLAGALREEFEAVAEGYAGFDAARLETQPERLAFWLDAYNVKLIERVLAAGVPANIEDHGFGFFFQTPVRVGSQEATLDEVEHVILRRQPGPPALAALAVERLDPRIHVGLNCGALSCPRLRRTAFTPENVDRELEAAMQDFVSSEQHLRRKGDVWVLSSLLDWFGEDFEAEGEPLGDVLLRYLDPARPDAAALRRLLGGRTAAELRALPGVRFEYLWALNRAR